MSLLQSQIFLVFLLLVPGIIATSTGTVVPLKARLWGTVYDTALTIGGQSLGVRVDTGSSDLWVVTPGWKCYVGKTSLSAAPASQKTCNYGDSTYKRTSTFQSAADGIWLGEHYGLGIAVGPVGYEDVKIGSISISQQEMAFANATSIPGDGYAEGVMGLAYPILGQVHPASVPLASVISLSQDLKDRILYPTVIERMLDMNITYFTMALKRVSMNQETGPGGYVAFGELPPVAHGPFVTVPVEEFHGLPLIYTNGTKKLAYWATTVESVSYGGKKKSQPFQAVVDSGNWVNMIPIDIATAINAAFDPPGKLVEYEGLEVYEVKCGATPPSSFGLQIGGQMFSIDSADMIWRDANGSCYSSVTPAPPAYGSSLAVLGAAFLKNVVAVFDYSKNEMKFASQTAGSSSTAAPSANAAVSLSTQFATVLAAVIVVATLI